MGVRENWHSCRHWKALEASSFLEEFFGPLNKIFQLPFKGVNTALTVMQVVGEVFQWAISVVYPMVREWVRTKQHLSIRPEKHIAVKGNLEVAIGEDVLF